MSVLLWFHLQRCGRMSDEGRLRCHYKCRGSGSGGEEGDGCQVGYFHGV